MKIITQNICPPIPIRCYDWVAWYDGREDWITGCGRTEKDAIDELIVARACQSEEEFEVDSM